MDKPARLQPNESGAERRFLTFRIDADFYALPADEVAEIVRVPAVARVPQAPASLMGIGNLRGSTIPVASLRALLGYAERDGGATARAIVLHGAAPAAVVCDAVEALIAVHPDQIQDSAAAARPGEKLKGVFRFRDNRDIAKVLDIHALLSAVFTPRARPARPQVVASATPSPETHANFINWQKLITFDAGGQEYALGIEAVREIVPAPESLMLLSHQESLSRGVMDYRGGLLPVFSLRGLLGLPSEPQDNEKVVVTLVGTMQIGLLVDRMRAILPADREMIEPIPPVLAARIGGESRIKAIYRGEGGRRLVSILGPQSLFREEVMQRLDAQRGAEQRSSDAGQAPASEAPFLVFRLGDDEYGLPIDVVDEVAHVTDKITRVPKTPKFLEGVINLRGEVLPIVDQRRRFDMPVLAEGERRRIIVVRTQRHRAGIIVDSVTEIVRCREDAIEPAPDLTGEATRLVSGIINLESAGRIILLLDPAELLTRTERGLLDAFAAKGSPRSSGS